MTLGEGLGAAKPAAEPTQLVAAHQRRPVTKSKADGEEPALFFDPERVPVETIAVPNPEIAGLAPAAYEIISERVTHRLAQRPGSYVVLKYVRQVVKRKDTAALSCPRPRRACWKAGART
jgi:transposase